MFSFLMNVVADLQKIRNGRPSAGPTRRRLGLESLEVRQLLSASPLVLAISPHVNLAAVQAPMIQNTAVMSVISLPVASDAVVQTPPAVVASPVLTGGPVVNDLVFQNLGAVGTPSIKYVAPDKANLPPLGNHPASPVDPYGINRTPPSAYLSADNFQDVTFNLHSATGTYEQLTIYSQSVGTTGPITFNATWDGANGTGVNVSGTLTAAWGHTDISFTWGSDHVFSGTISGNPGSYHIEGTSGVNAVLDPTTSLGAGATMHMVGDQVHMPDLTGEKWRMLSDRTSGVYPLQIVSQHNGNLHDATFTGIWQDKVPVKGALDYRADGSISITFSWGTSQIHYFEGTISSDPSHSTLSGEVLDFYGNLIGPGKVSGPRVR